MERVIPDGRDRTGRLKHNTLVQNGLYAARFFLAGADLSLFDKNDWTTKLAASSSLLGIFVTFSPDWLFEFEKACACSFRHADF